MEANDEGLSSPVPQEVPGSIKLKTFMHQNVIRAGLDTTLGEAMTICFQHRIRHLPVVESNGRLAGLVTDRDLRFYISHRLGTIMENNSDRETLNHHLHVIMVRRVITGTPDMTLIEAARLMHLHHVGCLPVVDDKNQILGIVTAGDFIHLIADGKLTFSPNSPVK